MFLFKKKKIVVDAFTADSAIHEFFPIKESSRFMPSWWKEMPSKIDVKTELGFDQSYATMKRCDGILDYYNTGFMLPLWSDIQIKTTADGGWATQWADQTNPMNVYSNPPEFLPKEFSNIIHFKIVSPWYVKEKTGVNFQWSHPFWNDLENITKYIIPSAVVNFKHQYSTNITMMFPKKDCTTQINAGEPLVRIAPLSESEVEIKNHLVSADEMQKIVRRDTHNFSISGRYKKAKRMTLKREEESKSKCPFGFGK